MQQKFKDRNLSTTILSLIVCGFIGPTAYAQSSEPVRMTGSHLKQNDLSRPVITVTAEELAAFNTINLEQYINTLPQVIPGNDGTSNNPGNGIATLDLRGFGPERTLVLVNGHRFGHANATSQTSNHLDGVGFDLNQIHAALIKNIDVATGGNSAVYGSDAVAGVVNIALRDRIEGMEVSGNAELTGNGDGLKTDVSLFWGNDFQAGRGNLTLFGGYSKRDGVFQSERNFSISENDDNGTGFDSLGSAGVPGTRIFEIFDFTAGGYSTDGTNCRGPSGVSTEGLSSTCTGNATFDENGQIIPWINAGPNTQRFNYAADEYLQMPQDRLSLAAFGHFYVSNKLNMKLSGIFTSNKVPQQLAPTPVFTTVSIDTANNPFLNPDARAVLRSTEFGQGIVPVFIGRRMLEAGPRRIENENEALYLSVDLNGEIDQNWRWNLHGHYSRTDRSVARLADISIGSIQNLILQGECNIFGAGNFSAACVDQVIRNTNTVSDSDQFNLVGTTSGYIPGLKLPNARYAPQMVIGFEYRKETMELQRDSLYGPHNEFSDTNGFVIPQALRGNIDSVDAFTEFSWPLIQGLKGAENLKLNGAYRITDHSNAGSMHSYRGGMNWEPIPNIRFYSTYDRSVRAPNIEELFGAQQIGFIGFIDPCAANWTGTDNFTIGRRDICLAEGVPDSLYGTQYDPGINKAYLLGGNQELSGEESISKIVGMNGSFGPERELFFDINYQSIKIENAIGEPDSLDILYGCYLGFSPKNCARVTRHPSGTINEIDATNQNFKRLELDVIDLRLISKWQVAGLREDDESGEINLQLNASYVFEKRLQNRNVFPQHFFDDPAALILNDPTDNCAGYHGAELRVCDEPIPKWKHVAILSYDSGPLNVTTRWRYIGNTNNDDGLNTNQSRTITDKFVSQTSAQNYFDLTSSWNVNDKITISGGVLNVFNNDPPILGNCCSEQANTWPATYDPLGRKFFVGANARF